MTRKGPYAPRSSSARGNAVPDAHVADMRYLHEEEGKTHLQVMEKYSQYSRSYVRSVLSYSVRANVKAKADDVVCTQHGSIRVGRVL